MTSVAEEPDEELDPRGGGGGGGIGRGSNHGGGGVSGCFGLLGAEATASCNARRLRHGFDADVLGTALGGTASVGTPSVGSGCV